MTLLCCDRVTLSGSSANNTADVVALGDSRYLPASGGKRGHRRGQEDSRSGNMADVSSELHTGVLGFTSNVTCSNVMVVCQKIDYVYAVFSQNQVR